MSGPLTEQELRAAHCWDNEDHVPRQPALTEFRRRLRYHQAQWREAHGHPIGTQPIVPKSNAGPARLVGSRIPLDYGRDRGANFLTGRAWEAAKERTSYVERHQSFDHQRLWADLLWSPALCFNLFGDLTADHRSADRALHTWWPDVPGTVSEIRFAHSPGRLDPAYLGNLVDFDVAFVLDLPDGTRGILAVTTAYHGINKRQPPKPARLPRYRQVSERSGAFAAEAMDAVNGTHLIHIWLAHVLVHSMLQNPDDRWTWGRHVVVHPAGNSDFANACAEYASLLVEPSTFASATIEGLLAVDALPSATTVAFRERYLPH
ncbi:MAG TPA: hypothetical protein VH761_07450 [Ilumatobacteraceae bacterium]